MLVSFGKTKGGDGLIKFEDGKKVGFYYIVRDKEKFEELTNLAQRDNLVTDTYYGGGNWSRKKVFEGKLGAKKMPKFMSLVSECGINLDECTKIDLVNKGSK